jgi:hypothetical protein
MSEKIKEAIKNCEDLTDTIMDMISDTLNENKIEFIQNNESEIVIENNTKENIREILLSMDVDLTTLKLLIQITENNDNVYIRQKFN